MRPVALVVTALQLLGTHDPRRAAPIEFGLPTCRHVPQFATQALAAREEGDGAVSLLFPAPLTEPHDILLAATEPATPPAPDAWAVFRDLRVYL